jgi:hypothetical protein
VIEDGVFHDNLSTNSVASALADIKNLPSQLTYVDNNPFLSYSVPKPTGPVSSNIYRPEFENYINDH